MRFIAFLKACWHRIVDIIPDMLGTSRVPAQQLRVDVLGALCGILILFLAARIPGSQGLQRLRYIILCGLTVEAATALGGKSFNT